MQQTYRAAACDVIFLSVVILSGGKILEYLYGNRRKFASFLQTGPAMVNELLQYIITSILCTQLVSITSDYGSAL